MNLLVAYDICTDSKRGEKRLRRVSKICINFGQRVQKSVYECQLSEEELVEFVHMLSEVVHPTEDNIRIYRVSGVAQGSVVNLGRAVGMDYSNPMII